MVLGQCVRLKCDAPKCHEVVHIALPGQTDQKIFLAIYLGTITEQGWVIPDLDKDPHEHFCYIHGVGAKLDAEVS